ncbi:velvet factor-domain-containing protein [Schizothecium vesticola]|uniref:Velvet factor-domain-containing protein n=1 Tax=Schizothecium vesticola TaxID=314040 RepID=A0AA40EUY2_9PEZI|nr:velvet factor-domain-containing protein [Schizothecium vesticola]
MHQPPYPPNQGHMAPDLHHSHGHQPPYTAHTMQQLPPMPPPAHYPQESLPMAVPSAPQQSPLTETSQQSSTQSQDRSTPLTPDQLAQQAANLKPYSKEDDNGWVYTLVVVQQPQRARMCGFGDKDRRPITPPPCVRLMVIDKKTGKEVNCNEIEHTMYVLNVDLWSEDALKEVNLVRHTTATPSISSTTPASYAAIEQSTPAYSNILPSNREVGYSTQMYQPPNPSVNPYAMQPPGYQGGYVSSNGGGYAPPNQYYPHEFRPEMQGMPLASQGPTYHQPRSYDPNPQFALSQRLSISGSQPQGMFTRNLIGSLAASAFRLVDTEDKDGIWFVLQDLSVRTEGNFRLRFSFVNVGAPMINGQPTVIHGKAPVLASVFSDVFQVYSAKKFPGVCESTPLSKCFATQGIKIPIRKEGPKGGNNDDDDGDYNN